MPVPALRIPLSVPMENFQRDMNRAKSIAGEAAQHIVARFVRMNAGIASSTNVGVAAIGGLAIAARRMVGGLALAGVSILALSAAIKAAAAELERMIELGEDAQKAGVGARFFQAFTEGARKATDEVKDFKAFLDRAFEATKPKIGGNSLVERLGEFSVAGLGNALQRYSAASTQEQRIRAILESMRELEAAGYRLEAFDIGERMFGAKFVDRLRTGQDTLDQMISRLDAAEARAKAGIDFLPQEQIDRARALNERLAEASRIIDRELTPAWNGLRSVMLDARSLFVHAAEGAAILLTALNGVLKALRDYQSEARAPLRDAALAARQLSRGIPATTLNPDPLGIGRGNPEAGARTPGVGDRIETTGKDNKLYEKPEKPTAAKEADETKDAFDRAIESINRHAARMLADAAAIGLNASAQESLRAELALLEAARRADNEITDEQIAAYTQLRATMSAQQALVAAGIKLEEENAAAFLRATARIKEVSAALDEKRTAFRNLEGDAKAFGSALSDAFKGLVLEGKNFLEVLNQMTQRLAGRAIDRLFDLVLFGPTGRLEAGGGIFGTLFGGFRADGGPVQAGKSYLVGERGPELVRFGQNGMVFPNKALAGGGATTIAPVYNIDARGADEAAIIRLERGLARTNQALARQGKAMAGAAHGQQFGVGIA